ncbi:hypothetical protein EON65_50620 [archaeon]|nr:MAG: hypothetical protein EON65_50620 [archaeon]
MEFGHFRTHHNHAIVRFEPLWLFPARHVSLLTSSTLFSHILIKFVLDRVKEMISFFNKTIAKRTPLGQRQSVQNEGEMCVSLVNSPNVFSALFIVLSCVDLIKHI